MKKTFKRKDGTEEVLEGTAEELAEYERKLNEQPTEPAKPDVLKGAPDMAELQKFIKQLMPSTCQQCFRSPCSCRWLITYDRCSDWGSCH